MLPSNFFRFHSQILQVAALAAAATLAGCATSPVPARAKSGAVASTVDYRNGWYHWAAPNQTIAAIAKIYQRDPAIVAELNKKPADLELEARTPIYVPPVEDRDELREIIGRVAANPGLIARTPPDAALLAAAGGSAQALGTREEASLPTDASYAPRAPRRGGSGFLWPVEGELLKKFSDEEKRPFRGVTIKAQPGSGVAAAAAGKVLFSGDLSGYGKMIILDHGQGLITCYGYNDKLLVSGNQEVVSGQRIALSGKPSEQAKGQVFFQIRQNNQPVDPMQYLK